MQLTIRAAWDWEPFDRACRQFKDLWAWLEANGKTDWGQIDRLAEAMHPEARCDPSRAPAAEVFLQLERGEFKRQWIAACAPWLLRELPPQRRGKLRNAMPTDGLRARLFVAAMLAAAEFARLQQAYKAEPRDAVAVARHLYWFERFFMLWELSAQVWRTGARPANEPRRSRARAWSDALLQAHAERVQRIGPRASARATALDCWHAAGAPDFEPAYRELLRRLKARPA